MAITAIVRRSISSVLPPVVRTVQRNSRNYALFTALYQCGSSTLSHKPCVRPFASSTLLHFYSSSTEKERPTPSADDTLLRAIESKIRSSEQFYEANIPWEIRDNPGRVTISLVKECKGELIEVTVFLLRDKDDDDDDAGYNGYKDNDDDDDDESGTICSVIPFYVRCSREDDICLGFVCFGVPGKIIITSLFIGDQETSEHQSAFQDFEEIGKSVQKAFYQYLEMRGIKPSIYDFLYDCMSNKKTKEYILWLKNVKKFVEA